MKQKLFETLQRKQKNSYQVPRQKLKSLDQSSKIFAKVAKGKFSNLTSKGLPIKPDQAISSWRWKLWSSAFKAGNNYEYGNRWTFNKSSPHYTIFTILYVVQNSSLLTIISHISSSPLRRLDRRRRTSLMAISPISTWNDKRKYERADFKKQKAATLIQM